MKITRTAVVGAGNMGSGIAQKIATEGFDVVLVDASLEQAKRGKDRIQTLLEEGVKRRIFSPTQVEDILQRIQPTHDFGELAEVDLVVEAIFEDLDIKRDLFKKLGVATKKNCLLATNTSSFLVKELAEACSHPERVLGLHYFYHPAKNRLVEVIGHDHSGPEYLAAAWTFQTQISKTPIASKDAPGFVVNRFFVPWLVEAVRLHDEGIDRVTIEEAAKEAFGVGMGPFELMNVTGVPITLHASRSLASNLGEFYAPPELLATQVESGQPWALAGESVPGKKAEVVQRLQGVVFHIASQLVTEGVSSFEDTDIGARVGLRWPEGPFEMINRVGILEAAHCAEAIEKRYDLAPTGILTKQLSLGHAFKLKRVNLRVKDGVGVVQINRPDQLNALDPETMAQLTLCFENAWQDDSVRGIVLEGAGKAFVAGADVKYFVDHMRSGEIDEIVAFATRGQELFARIATSPKKVVCKLDGLALGGGAELALACHVIVASPRASFGFPETGIGIYPGLGGTQRLMARLGSGLARLMLYSGEVLQASELAKWQIAWRVVPVDEMDAVVAMALQEAPTRAKVDIDTLDADRQTMAAFIQSEDITRILARELDIPESEQIAKWLKRIGHKAPNAIEKVQELTDKSTYTGNLDEGLKAETDGLHAIFSHPNALEGMAALLEGRRPQFQK
jgi:enoyl-CoA hydratase / 3-hydroxyacyl-CoA dehydrogenase